MICEFSLILFLAAGAPQIAEDLPNENVCRTMGETMLRVTPAFKSFECKPQITKQGKCYHHGKR